MPTVNSLLGVYIYIAEYHFAVLNVRSQSDSTTLLPGLLTITNYRTGSYVWGKKPKKVSIYAYLCRHFHSVIYLWRIGMLMNAQGNLLLGFLRSEHTHGAAERNDHK